MRSISLPNNLTRRWYYGLLLLHPFLVALIQPHVLFTQPRTDASWTLGASLNFDQLAPLREFDRHFDRLPAIIFSHLFYKVFPAMLAHHLLYYLFFVATLFAMFAVMRRLLSEQSAFVATLFFSVNFWVIPTFGDVWLTRYVVLFLFLALLFMLRCSEEESPLTFGLIGGFFTGCTLLSHFASAPFLFEAPLLYLIGILLRRTFTPTKLLNAANYVVNGLICAVLFFGSLNALFFKGKFFFFMHQAALTAWDFSKRPTAFAAIFEALSTNLIPIAFGAALVALLSKTQNQQKKIIALWFVVATAMYIVLINVGKVLMPQSPIFPLVLYHPYYHLWILPVCSVTILTCLLPTSLEWGSKQVLGFYGLCLLSMSPLAQLLLRPLTTHLPSLNTASIAGLGVLIVALAAVPKRGFQAAALGTALLMNGLLFAAFPLVKANKFADRTYFKRVYDGNRFLQKLNLTPPIYSWLGRKDNDFAEWTELLSFPTLWLSELKSIYGFPTFTDEAFMGFNSAAFTFNNTIILADGNPKNDALARANATLAKYDRNLTELSRIELGSGPDRYDLIACRVGTGVSWDSIPGTSFSNQPITNLVTNGTFGDGLTGWDGPSDCSRAFPGSPEFHWKFVDESFDGRKQHKSLEVETLGHIIGLRTVVTTLQPGKLYSLRIRFKSVRTSVNGMNPKVLKAGEYPPTDIFYMADSVGEVVPLLLPRRAVDSDKTAAQAGWLEEFMYFRAREAGVTLTIYSMSRGEFKNTCTFDSVVIEPLRRPM